MLRSQFFSPDKRPTRIRLIPFTPEQLWFDYYGKWIKIKDTNGKQVSRFVIGNSHNGEREVPDLLYYYAVEGQKADLMASQSSVVTVVVLEDFHEVEAGKTKKGTPFYKPVRCNGKNRFNQVVCEECNKGTKKSFGLKRHWSMWPSARRTFEQQLEELSSRCMSCNKGMISVYAYACASCGTQLANHYDAPIDAEIEEALRNEDIECEHCKAVGRAKQLEECVVRHGDGEDATFSEGCKNPKRPAPVENLWDYDLTVVEETVGNASRVVITHFSPSSEGPQLGGDLAQPYDFLFFDRMTIEDQIKAMGRPMPREWGSEKDIQDLVDQYFQDRAHAQAATDQDETDVESVAW